jgi:hypothetical protein
MYVKDVAEYHYICIKPFNRYTLWQKSHTICDITTLRSLQNVLTINLKTNRLILNENVSFSHIASHCSSY